MPLNFMKNGYILWFLMIIPIMAILILSENKKHKEDKMKAGIILKKLTISKKQQFIRIITDAIIVIFIIFIFPQIRKMDSALITLPVPYFILPISIGIIIAFFINRPQMICENGILDRFALIEWSNIKKIKKSNTCENEIIIILQTPIHKNNQIRICCLPKDVDNVVQLIENQISKESSHDCLDL